MMDIWPDSVEFPHLERINSINDWKEAVKQIYNEQDVANFQKSISLQNIQCTLFKICSLVSGKNIPNGVLDDDLVNSKELVSERLAPPSALVEISNTKSEVGSVLSFLKEFDSMLETNPPLPGPRRYGNMACRSWHDQLDREVDELFTKHLSQHYKYDNFNGFKKESRHYILNSFGSRQRLDYGTGHELSFLAFINALIMCDILDKDTITGDDFLIIFAKYYDLVKKLILNYTLEPAGSHGVWGLDDHFHLVYILGSAQFVEYNRSPLDKSTRKMVPSPSSVLKPMTLRKYRTSNLYFNAISFIKRVKTGPFNEHSPILYDISAVKTWKKVNQGMIKMWFVEVLSKFPVVQHFYFGNVLYPWKDLDGSALPRSSEADRNKLDEELLKLDNEISTYSPWLHNSLRPNPSVKPSVPDQVVTKAPWAK